MNILPALTPEFTSEEHENFQIESINFGVTIRINGTGDV
jgi:hypothetical protein